MCTNEACCYYAKRGKCIHDNKYNLPATVITGTFFMFLCPMCNKEHSCMDKKAARILIENVQSYGEKNV
jgi:hypothetical protein